MDQKIITRIEEELDQLLNKANLVEGLKDSCKYSVLNGGKRIRPRIAAAVLSDLTGTSKDTQKDLTVNSYIDLFCALEFLHCSSLIHDDLPCMDNDDFRRGKPTSHKVYGEAHALLTGDVLVSIAFQAILCCKELPVEKKHLLTNELSQTYIELCNGQLWDLDPEKRQTALTEIHQKKTGSLFGCAFLFGGVVACSDKNVYDMLRDLGQEWGLFFQYLDDYLDVVGDPTKRGRPSGSDQKNNRTTDVSEELLQRAKQKLNDKISSLEETIQGPMVSVRKIFEELTPQ